MNYYSTLGITKNASSSDIKTAYKKLAMQYHPDRGGNETKFKEISEAYDTLKDLLYQERIDGYFDKEVIEEILGLDIVYGDKVDARPGMKKDRADAVAGAVHSV